MNLLKITNFHNHIKSFSSIGIQLFSSTHRKYTIAIIFCFYWALAVLIINYTLNERFDSANKLLATSVVALKSNLNQKMAIANLDTYKEYIYNSGSTLPPLSENDVLHNIANLFRAQKKPVLVVEKTPWDIRKYYEINTYNITFKAQHDFEIFEMANYIFNHTQKFGNVRIKELNISQIFDDTPIVKGKLSYEQMSILK